MKYAAYREDVFSALNAARNGNIISRGAIEREVEQNRGRYPRLGQKTGQALRMAISGVLIGEPGISVISSKRPVFLIGGS